MASASLEQSVCAVVGNRPDRAEPRGNKRRPKVLKLMTIPRRVFHAAHATLKKNRKSLWTTPFGSKRFLNQNLVNRHGFVRVNREGRLLDRIAEQRLNTDAG